MGRQAGVHLKLLEAYRLDMYIYIYAYIYIYNMYIYMYIYIYIHVYIYTHSFEAILESSWGGLGSSGDLLVMGWAFGFEDHFLYVFENHFCF